jgi:hypothetical protein
VRPAKDGGHEGVRMTETTRGGFGIGDKVRTTKDLCRNPQTGVPILRKGAPGTIVRRVVDDKWVAGFGPRGAYPFNIWEDQMELVRKATRRDVLRLLSKEVGPNGTVSLVFDLLGLPPEWLEEFAEFVKSRRRSPSHE